MAHINSLDEVVRTPLCLLLTGAGKHQQKDEQKYTVGHERLRYRNKDKNPAVPLDWRSFEPVRANLTSFGIHFVGSQTEIIISAQTSFIPSTP